MRQLTTFGGRSIDTMEQISTALSYPGFSGPNSDAIGQQHYTAETELHQRRSNIHGPDKHPQHNERARSFNYPSPRPCKLVLSC